jgi:hypothetical protein
MDEWNKYSVHVLEELKRLNANIQKIDEGQRKIEKDLVKIQTKSRVWGGVAGVVVTICTQFLFAFFKVKQ